MGRAHIDLSWLAGMMGDDQLKENPDYGKDPSQVDYHYKGDPSQLVQNPYLKPSAFASLVNPQLMQDYNKFQYAPIEQSQKLKFAADLAKQNETIQKAQDVANAKAAASFARPDIFPTVDSVSDDYATKLVGAYGGRFTPGQMRSGLTDIAYIGQNGPQNAGSLQALNDQTALAQAQLANTLGTPSLLTQGANAAAKLGLDQTNAKIGSLPGETELARLTTGNNTAYQQNVVPAQQSLALAQANSAMSLLPKQTSLADVTADNAINYQRANVPAAQRLDLGQTNNRLANLDMQQKADVLGLQNRIFEGTHGVSIGQLPSTRDLATLAGDQVSYARNPLYVSPEMQKFDDSMAIMQKLKNGGMDSGIGAVAANAGFSKAPVSFPISGAPTPTAGMPAGVAAGTNQRLGVPEGFNTTPTSDGLINNANYREQIAKIPESKQYLVREEFLNALGEELGVQPESIGDSTLNWSLSRTVNSKILHDPEFKKQIENLSPEQEDAIYRKVLSKVARK